MRFVLSALFLLVSADIVAQNPYLPLTEHIPDAEPYVFDDPDVPGRQRLYIFGSHDSMVNGYCGREQVFYSTSVDSLAQWRQETTFVSTHDAQGRPLRPDGLGDVLFAPDVAEVVDAQGVRTYYLYPNNQAGGRQSMVARSQRPGGPYEVCNWQPDDARRTKGILGFDPAVFVDDDGRVYGYWGFKESWAAELDPQTMCTVRPGCQPIRHLVSSCDSVGIFRFFEASSMRKVADKYILVYSRITEPGESGLPASNYTLAYAYGDSPLGPFTYGGTLVDARAPGLDAQGRPVATAFPYGNTHGSLTEVGGRWWVFYHRQTGLDEYSRQPMVDPVNLTVEPGRGGRVIISRAEVTSQGFRTDGLDATACIEASWACFFRHPRPVEAHYPTYDVHGSYVCRPTAYDSLATVADSQSCNLTTTSGSQSCIGCVTTDGFCGPLGALPAVVNNTPGSVIGFKYLNFDGVGNSARPHSDSQQPQGVSCPQSPQPILHSAFGQQYSQPLQVQLRLTPQAGGVIRILLDAPTEAEGGMLIATASVPKNVGMQSSGLQDIVTLTVPTQGLDGVGGKHALYLAYTSASAAYTDTPSTSIGLSDHLDASVCRLYTLRFIVP